jgi:UDP-glucuronate 4-epimerase
MSPAAGRPRALDEAADLANPDVIVHLAAQAGVRYSLEAPRTYIDSNLVGSWNVLELARELKPRH